MSDVYPASLNNDEFMMEEPLRYNDAVVNFFKKKYKRELELVFQELEEKADPELNPWLAYSLTSIPKRIIERHLFPVFAAGSCSGGLTTYHLVFCNAFIRAISLPVLRIDNQIDRPLKVGNDEQEGTDILSNTSLTELCLLHEGLSDMCTLPHAKKILKLAISSYLRIYSSLYYEISQRYDLKYLSHPEKYMKWIFHSPSSPLTCKYFSVTVQTAVLLNSKSISPNVRRVTEAFGRLRQLCDQICDVKEDIVMGKVTIPVLYALLNDSNELSSMIRTLWTEMQGSESPAKSSRRYSLVTKIKNTIRELKGFKRAYTLADKWYQQAVKCISNANQEPGFGPEIILLFRLKRAFLERLKINNWADIPNFY